MPRREAIVMLAVDHFSSSLNDDISGEKSFLDFTMTIMSTMATIEPPMKEWKKP